MLSRAETGKAGAIGAGRLKTRQLALFSLPILVVDAIEFPWRAYLPALFTGRLGLPLASVGVLVMLIRLFDMLLDPAIGWASDRFPTRFGQRRPWIAAGIPFVLVGAWQVYFATPGIGIAMLALWCVILHVGFTLITTPHGAWTLEIGGSDRERTRIMVARTWFGVAGIPMIVLLPSILERWHGAGRSEQVAAMGALLIVLTPLTLLPLLSLFREPPADRAVAARTIDPFRQFAAMLRDRQMRIVVILYALVGLAEAASSGTFIFFIEDALGLKGWASTLLLIQSLLVLLALPCWGAISDRLGRRRALALVFAWQMSAMAVALFLPVGSLTPAIIFIAIRGAASGGDFLLLRAMVADFSGRDRDNGMRRSGSYYALFNVTLKLAMSLGAGAALWLLAATGFEASDMAIHGTHAMLATRLIYTLPTLVAGTLGLLILLRERGRRTLTALSVGNVLGNMEPGLEDSGTGNHRRPYLASGGR